MDDTTEKYPPPERALRSINEAQARFLHHVREAARSEVGYGWMQQAIEIEWAHRAEKNGVPGSAWGPMFYERERVKLLKQVEVAIVDTVREGVEKSGSRAGVADGMFSRLLERVREIFR